MNRINRNVNSSKKTRSALVIMMRLIKLVGPLTGYMALAVVMGVLGNACASSITILGGFAVARVLGLFDAASLGALFAIAAAAAVARGLLRYAEQSCNHFIAFKLLALIRDRVFGALRRLCPAKLEGRDKGDLISVITGDIELLEVFYAHTVSPVCIAVLFCAAMIALIGRYHALLGLLAAVAYLTVGVAVPLVAAHYSRDAALRFRTASGRLSSFVLSSLRGLDEILQYRCGEDRLKQIDGATDDLCRDEANVKRAAGRSGAATGAIILIFDLLMLFCAAHLCGFRGALVCTLALMSSFGPCVALSALGTTLQSTLAAGNRVLDILDEAPQTQEITGKAPAAFGDAAARNVTFSYGAQSILNDLSADFPQGKMIGVVGQSGCGKSTLLKLLMRFWQVDGGSISIRQTNIDEINTSDLRDMESYVTQQTHLFHDSIRSNLCVAKPDATDEELIRACKRASIHDFIMSLPQGYDTPVGELGGTLSGGERQRLGLARAFLHDAPLVLLDEPTANLDSLNEGAILKSLHEARSGKTIVLVSHRASTVAAADVCYRIESGRIVHENS